MAIKINNIITATEYVNKVKLATQEEREGGYLGTGRHRLYAITPDDLPALAWLPGVRAAELLTDFYDCVLANTHPADVHDLWEPRGMVVACSGESETVKQLMKQHLQDNGWDAQIMPVAVGCYMPPDITHVVVKRPKGV